MITTWLFEFFHALRDPAHNADAAKVQAHFDWYTDLWTKCEARGWDGIFFSEHHFGAAYAPSPNLLVANIAARTSTMRLGVLGSVTPYATPWRVAEEFAMLTHLTGGRFEAGIVSGIPPELGVAGVPMPVASARHAAIADVLDSLADDPIITQHTDEWNINELELFPRWDRTRGLWTACRSKDSAERAGRRGWKVCGGFNSTAVLAEMFDGYRKAAESAGHEVDDSHLAIRRMVTFVDSPSQQREGMHTAKRSLLGLLNASAGPLPPFAALLDRPDESIDMLSNDEFVSGTPDQVADELINQCREVGAANVMVMFSAVERNELEHAHRLFAEHVIPHLQNASLV